MSGQYPTREGLMTALGSIAEALGLKEFARATTEVDELRAWITRGKAGWRKRTRGKKGKKSRKQADSLLKGPSRMDLRSQDLGYDDYAHYLNSPHWNDVKARYRKAWPACSCIACHSSTYDLHHVQYDRFGHEGLSDLIPLCRTCHQMVHAASERERLSVWEFRAICRAAFGWSHAEYDSRMAGYQTWILRMV